MSLKNIYIDASIYVEAEDVDYVDKIREWLLAAIDSLVEEGLVDNVIDIDVLVDVYDELTNETESRRIVGNGSWDKGSFGDK